MKIIVSATLGGGSAGTWYAIESARRLAARGHRVFYLSRPGDSSVSKSQAAGLTVIDQIDLEEKSPSRMYRNLRRLLGLISEIGPDVVLAHGGEDHAFWGLAKAIRAHELALIRVRTLDPKPPKRHPLSIWLHRKATDLVVTGNSRHHAAYHSRLGIPFDRLAIIEPGIEPEDFADLGEAAMDENDVTLPEGKHCVVMVARFAPIKGHRVLLAAAGRIKRQRDDVRFLFVGYEQAYTMESLRRWVVEANLQDSITVIGRMVPHLPALLSRCDLGVIASIGSETVSRSLLEYLGSGLPVVATDVGGIPDLLSRGDFGRRVRPDDASALAAAIVDMIDHPDQRTACGRNGRQYVLSHCTWDQRVDQWEEVLYRTVSRVRGDSIPRLSSDPPPDVVVDRPCP